MPAPQKILRLWAARAQQKRGSRRAAAAFCCR
jgi:hypothetical protein